MPDYKKGETTYITEQSSQNPPFLRIGHIRKQCKALRHIPRLFHPQQIQMQVVAAKSDVLPLAPQLVDLIYRVTVHVDDWCHSSPCFIVYLLPGFPT